jgi:very-short-patch-repair endonuclease
MSGEDGHGGPMRPTTPAEIAEVLRAQHGHVTRDQLLQAGMSARTIRRREASGELVRAGHRTWRSPAVPLGPTAMVLGASLDCGGVATHWAGTWMHGRVPTLREIDITIPRSRSLWLPPSIRTSASPRVRLHTSTDLPADDIVEIRGVPTASLARSLLSLASLVPRELSQARLEELVAAACEDDRTRERWFLWLLDRRRVSGRDGIIAFEEALASQMRLGPTESWLERTLVRVIVEAGLPRPIVQRRVDRRGRFVGRVDITFQGTHLIVEALGYAHHRSRADLERDTRRANALQLAGFRVLQYGYDQIVNDPCSVVLDIADALGITRTPAA